MFYDVFSNELQPLLAPDQRLDPRPLAFKGFLLNLVLILKFCIHGFVQMRTFIFIKLNAGKAAFIIEGDGRAVFHGTADIVNVNIVAKNTRRIHIVSLDRRSGKPDKGGSGQRVAKIFGKPIRNFTGIFLYLGFQTILAPVRFIGNDDHIAPRCQHGVFVALFRGKLLNRSENDAPGIAVEEPLEIFATLRLYRRLPNQIMAHGERGKELIIKIIAVGKNHNRGILHGGMQDEPPGIKSHEQTLSRSLRMPDDPCALIALRQRRLYRTIHGMANGMELMIPRQNFDESVFLHKNRTIADKLQKTPPFKNTFRQHGEFGHPLGSYG